MSPQEVIQGFARVIEGCIQRDKIVRFRSQDPAGEIAIHIRNLPKSFSDTNAWTDFFDSWGVVPEKVRTFKDLFWDPKQIFDAKKNGKIATTWRRKGETAKRQKSRKPRPKALAK